ncbi:MAG: hypothetical protein HOG30_05180 [Candidatus Marinimicrobia bacterium]|jgi:hypothetical protein|nr:hypothetical protein [Candidatus Neomarinimicrobiota bacterium]MBT6737888.1 hypothetical protein [Candidatus Neomarinimicrobiota bacterium]MBT6914472.1 hypothetical protein [Candidatus Neomarinimicrobiota bacterium]MBT7358798.1 hypothetical protein [Candidatus Neomarinimicrobiota bacterium]
MCLSHKSWIFPGLLCFSVLLGQTTSHTDTLTFQSGVSIYALSHPFVLSESLHCLSHTSAIIDSIDEIHGNVYLADLPKLGTNIIFSYESLQNPIPKRVSPLLNFINISTELDKSIADDKKSIQAINQENNVSTAGSFYRQLNLSQKGGSEFTGGLKFQIQGFVNEDIQISGFMSDEDIPLQPEGNTQRLQEIDQIFLQLTHPKDVLEIGDIDYNINLGKLINYRRKQIGIKNIFNTNNTEVHSILSNSKSQFQRMTFYGKDGMQGPYFLSSKNGNVDIVVQAGTEKVWLDGKELIRGENHDYIMDYHAGEILFTAQNLIHFDSEIYIEFQYNDFQYTRNLFGSGFTKSFSRRGEFSLHWVQESDFISQDRSELSSEMLSALESAGDTDIFLEGDIADSTGDYFWQDSIWIYKDEWTGETSSRSSVIFHYDPNGNYIKKISQSGQLYYQYSHKKNDTDLSYSPGQKGVSPIANRLFYMSSNWDFSDDIQLSLELARSNHDLNTLSSLEDEDNLGYSYFLKFDKETGQSSENFILNYRFRDWMKSTHYASLSRDEDILFNTAWNLNSPLSKKLRVTDGNFSLNWPKIGKTKAEYAVLHFGDIAKERFQFQQNISMPFFNNSVFKINRVLNDSSLYFQQSVYLSLFSGSLHPYFSYDEELDEKIKSFRKICLGLKRKINSNTWNISLRHRKDEVELDSLSSGLELSQEGWFGEFDYLSEFQKAWRTKLTIRNRIQRDEIHQKDLNYILGLAQISFRERNHPAQWDFQFNSEETFKENRVVVYDSVGLGLGQYRYDSDFNDYISDPNGSYIAQSIPSGILKQNTSIASMQRFVFDFLKRNQKNSIPMRIQIENRLDFQGDANQAQNMISPSIKDSSVVRSRWNHKIKVDYSPILSLTKFQSWVQISRDMNGMDSRGNDIKNQRESALLFENKRLGNWRMKSRVQWNYFKMESGLSVLRNREINDWWTETKFTKKIHSDLQWTIGLQGGAGRGSHSESAFTANDIGLSLEGKIFFLKKGRIESKWTWDHVRLESGDILPPEALMGHPVGDAFQTQTRFRWMMDQRVSLNLSLLTIRDSRYGNLITFNGEFRAYF